MAYFALTADPSGVTSRDLTQYEVELRQLQDENSALQEQVGRQETELNKLRAQLGGVREERDRWKRRVRDE